MKLLLPIIIVLLAAAGYFAVNQKTILPGKAPSSSPTSQELKTFQSESQNFSVMIPAKFQVKEKFTTVEFSIQGDLIMISRNSTNFDNIDDYLNNLAKLNKVELKGKEKLTINSLSATRAFVDNTKTYFLHTGNRVYSISTSTEILYHELDQIAQSFRYIP